MTCSQCGGPVIWKGPLTNLSHTECLRCGAKNAQVPEYETDEQEEVAETSQHSLPEETP